MRPMAVWIAHTGEGFLSYGLNPIAGPMLTKSSSEADGLPCTLDALRARLISQRQAGFLTADQHEALLDQASQLDAAPDVESKIRLSARFGFDALTEADVFNPGVTFEDALRATREDAAQLNAAKAKREGGGVLGFKAPRGLV